MKQRLFRFPLLLVALLIVATTTLAAPSSVPLSDLFPTPTQTKSAIVINKVLERYHYRKVALDRDFAASVLERYLKALDPNRTFFLARDVERFRNGARQLDESLRRGELDIAFDIFRVYRMRVDERVAHALKLLDGRFTLDTAETFTFESDETPWARDAAELDERWRKRVKHDYLSLRLADKSDAEIRDRLRKRYEGLARRIHQFKGDDVFQAFMNAYTETIEPHTSYMSPSTSENFDISMKLSLEGIGAVLRSDNEYTLVQSTVPGGPARESGQVHAGDQILGVAQGLDGPMEDVVGWRLEDVVDKIRGPKGSVVRLQIQPKATGSSKPVREVALVRNEIKLEDQAAKSYVVDDLGNAPGLKVGVIEIPAFYRDFEAEGSGTADFRSTTRDVRRLINDLVMRGIDGLLIDLRSNGGGSLAEATSLTGLFIDTGPVVQVKDAFGKVEVEADRDPGVAYNGPLAVLVDRESASASEIFAAAIQDYGRGLIIGEPTFGKGTVQTLIDLNRYVPGEKSDLGRLRLTMAEFFRISGGSTQLRGVEPDIRFPSADYISEHGERSLDNALPWTQIDPAGFRKVGELRFDALARRSAERVARDEGFRMLTERSRLVREVEEQKQVSLRESERRAEDERRNQRFKADQERFLRARGLTPVDEEADQVDEEALEKQREVIARIEAEEAARILADGILMQRTDNGPRAVMRN
ncbi:carboxy terminal-processing peptidase [Allochromatium vinosum]|uniref:Carboxyl-terminal protease n=1 Tax=Allochromatium vinosum (strain ATCC 17899 / DSM 180 / NBRC 103801 / NCIMB 10441 / D) TaxID=572477 RepID=D3RQE1_ALLVD|nr:carboxy terminal-processing peptidase [Allochromatium vinosum]ADC61746.1 carboxyl-terminal protease [Allochromatium vinosum DSM 180]